MANDQQPLHSVVDSGDDAQQPIHARGIQRLLQFDHRLLKAHGLQQQIRRSAGPNSWAADDSIKTGLSISKPHAQTQCVTLA